MAEEKVEPRIVEAVGVSANSLHPAGRARAQVIEAAMSAAVAASYSEGVRDPVRVRERMMAARQKVIDEWAVPVPSIDPRPEKT